MTEEEWLVVGRKVTFGNPTLQSNGKWEYRLDQTSPINQKIMKKEETVCDSILDCMRELSFKLR